MTTLRIRWTGGEATFEPGATVRVGRDLDADIQPQNPNVSRHHVELTHVSSGWVLRDVGSAQGTWRNGRQVDSVEIRGTVQVTLGREGRGEVLTLETSAVALDAVGPTELPGRGAPVAATQIVGGPAAGGTVVAGSGEGTVIVGAPASHRPGGPLRADAVIGDTVVTGDVLNVECAGRSYSFSPGRDVRVGRDDDCEITSANPTVSRHHARITHDGSGWTLRDEGSSGGTFVDGKRITEQALSGSIAAWLGDQTTGERLVMVASGTSPIRSGSSLGSSRSRKVALIVAGAVVALVAAGVLVSKMLETSPPTDDELGQATVRLIAGDLTGSGTIIDAGEGLILTNAHVVAPDSPGSAVREVTFGHLLDPSPREVTVLVAPALGKAAEPRFIATVETVDGYLDLAVLKIKRTVGGGIVNPDSGDLDGLVEVAIGDSSGLSAGDDIRVVGYPTAAQTPSVTLTEGTISGEVPNERMGTNSGMLNITAEVSPGNSGGLAVNDVGELIGVPTLIRDETVASMRPSEFAGDLIDAARSGEDYVSPWFRPLEGEEVSNVQIVEPGNGVGTDFECPNGTLSSLDAGAVGVSFDYKGFTEDEHQDLMVVVRAGDSIVGLWTMDHEYPVQWPESSGCATVTVPTNTPDGPPDLTTLTATIGLGPEHDTTP